MKTRLEFLKCCLALLTLTLVGCSATQVKESWRNPELAGAELGKVLVVAIASEETRRNLFEVELASALESASVDATARARIPSLRGKPGRERVIEVVQAENFDHVLVTRLAAIREDEVQHVGYTEYELYGVRGRFGRYWITGVEEIEHPSWTETETRLYVETSLFETGEGQLAWRMRTETKNPEYVDLAEELVNATVRRLRTDGLIE